MEVVEVVEAALGRGKGRGIRSRGGSLAKGIAALSLAGLIGGAGCSNVNIPTPDFTKILPAGTPEPTHVALGSWHKDHLECTKGRCDNFYTIDVLEKGQLKVEAYAPQGEGVPDFGLVLLDPMGLQVATSGGPDERPKRLMSVVDPGRYVVKVHGQSGDDVRIGYELIARWSEPERKVVRKKRRSQKRAPEPKPPPEVASTAASSPAETSSEAVTLAAGSAAAPAAPTGLQSEVLDVENEGGAPRFVLLEVGAPDALEPGMSGRLWNGDRVIGRFEIDEVYRHGSRAKIDGDLDGEITLDTVAEILR